MRCCRHTMFAMVFVLLVRVSLAAAQAPALDRIVDRFVLDVEVTFLVDDLFVAHALVGVRIATAT